MTVQQLTKAEIDRLWRDKNYRAIEQARREGRANVIMGGEAPPDLDGVITPEIVTNLFQSRQYDRIEQLRAAGRLDHLMQAPTTTSTANKEN